MDNLKDTLRRVMEGYTGKGLNDISYLTWNDEQNVYAVVSVGKWQGKHIADSSLIARLVGDKIVIEQDMNDKILMDALLQDGVPREQIVLAYAGETLPETESQPAP
ncbi:MAG: XisI protein [Chloroflexi bacterium]|nr:XisI protein [Chloroflexota bacterium]